MERRPPGVRRVPEPDAVHAAFSFVREVRARFASDPAASDEFTGLLAGFGAGEVTDARAVVARAEALLQGHPDLVVRFNEFLVAPKSTPNQASSRYS